MYRPDETQEMLEFLPDRLGHMCCLNDSLESILLSSSIAVELCLSSNVITESVSDYPDHHFSKLYKAGMHISVLTPTVRGIRGSSIADPLTILMFVWLFLFGCAMRKYTGHVSCANIPNCIVDKAPTFLHASARI